MNNPFVRFAVSIAVASTLVAASASAQQAQGAGGQDEKSPQAAGSVQAGDKAGTAAEPVIISLSIPVWDISPGAIAAAPTAFYGSIVTVDAEVEEVLGRNVFTLDEDRVGAGPDVLVIAPRPITAPEDEVVRVIGHVRPFVSTQLERDYDWFDTDWTSEATIKLDERPAIIAASITTKEGRELLPPPDDTQAAMGGAQQRGDTQTGTAPRGDGMEEDAETQGADAVQEDAETQGGDAATGGNEGAER